MRYEWQRFWCAREGSFSLDDGGYLVDPTTTWGRALNPHLRSIGDLAETRCLVLLGEPGIGKTVAIREECERLSANEGDSPEVPVKIDLRSYGSEDRLWRDLTGGDYPGISNWLAGEGRLTLFLDSLDECLLRIDTLATLLPEALGQLPVDRLLLRLACRTGDWPQTLEEGLGRLFGRESVSVYELAPLRRADVAAATTACGLDPNAFLHDVAEREVQALANRPVTLQFLISAKQESGTLPQSRLELYLRGCRLLAAERNQARFEGPYRGRLTTDERLTLAERVAAATVFGNRAAVWTGPEDGPSVAEDVTFRDLRTVPQGSLAPSDHDLDEVFGTGLFSSRGPHRLGWAHQTYAEFLAARWSVTAGLEPDQILALLANPHDPERRLAPQLHETAGWVASMRPDVFRTLVSLEPEALLRGDAATAGPHQRFVLTKALLDGYNSQRILDTDWDLRRLYRKLAHPDLAAQLRPVIADRSKGMVVRRAAINIAEACQVTEVQGELLEVALDGREVQGLRTEAASAVVLVADAEHRLRLRALLTLDRNEDPDDELRGHALGALWPAHLSTEEMFAHLSPPRNPDLYGQYEHFVKRLLPDGLAHGDLAVALDWVLRREPERGQHGGALEDLADEILIRVCRHRPTGPMLHALARVVLLRAQQAHPVVDRERQTELAHLLSADTELRHDLVVAMLEHMEDEATVWALWRGGASLIDRADMPWLLDWIVQGHGSDRAKRLGAVALVRFLFHPRRAEDVNMLLERVGDSEYLRGAMAPFTDPVELDSPRAAAMRSAHDDHQAVERRWKELEQRRAAPLVPAPAERVRAALEGCEVGNPDGFWQLTLELSVAENSGRYEREFAADLTSLPGWEAADPETRARVIKAAGDYVRSRDPAPAHWLGTNVWHRPAFAGYKALRLLATMNPSFVADLTPADWARWAPVIVAYPSVGDTSDRGIRTELLAQAYAAAPDALIDALSQCLDRDNREHGHAFGLEAYEHLGDERMARTFLRKVTEPSTKPDAFRELLWQALIHRLPEAVDYARSLLEAPLSGSVDRAVIAASLLLRVLPGETHDLILSLLDRNEEFGRALVSTLATSPYQPTIQGLPEDALARLYIGISRHYPHSEDPEVEGAHIVGAREQIAWFRNAVLGALKERGSQDAVRAIESIIAELPGVDWLKYTLHEARVRTRSRTWTPPTPTEVLALGGTAQGRLVRSGAELLDAVLASLRRLEARLQGETPAAPDLWNQIEDRYRPKDEDALSNYVKRHFDEDLKRHGAIVNREVQIRRGEGTGVGERTDIHVDAVVCDRAGKSADVVTVIVETKGCWHDELHTAMETQLVNRYLKDNQCRHGLYLVGWFECHQWDPSDRRRGVCARTSREDLASGLLTQAERLSGPDTDVRAVVLNAALR